MNVPSSNNPQAGFSAIEALGALLGFMILLPSLYHLWENGMTEMKKRAVAQHLTDVTAAASSYGRKHYNALIDQSTSTSGPTISIEDLRREQFLANNFNTLNPWRQSYSIYSREPKEGELQLVILTQGGLGHETNRPEFGNRIVPSTAALAQGGFIPTGLSGQPSGSLQGAYNAWRLDLGTMGIPSPGAGHIGAVTNLSSFEVGHDFLYRIAVPGHPDLDAMQTDLDMTDHLINNVKEVHFTPHALAEIDEFCTGIDEHNGRVFLHENEGLYICRNGRAEAIADTGNSAQVRDMTIAGHGDIIKKPVCPEGIDVEPQIFLTPVSVVESIDKATPIIAMQSWASDFSDTQWQVHLRLMTAESSKSKTWVYPTADLGQVMVTTVCRKTLREVSP